MKKIKLTEADLIKLIEKVINEEQEEGDLLDVNINLLSS